MEITLPSYTISFGARPKIKHRGKVLVITNPKIAGLHLQKLLANLEATEV